MKVPSRRFWTLLVSQIAMGCLTALAADSPSAPETLPSPETGATLLRTAGGLGMVLALIAAGYFLVKKFAPQYLAKSGSGKNLRVVETLTMGDKRSLALVEVGHSRFLLGNTPHQINLLCALADETLALARPEAAAKPPLRKLAEVDKSRSFLPDDLRSKMRQLREALER